jgi:uncharacterized protein
MNTMNPTDTTPATHSDDEVLAAMRRWLERAVIGLNLCPFAKAVHVKDQIRWVVSAATTPEALQAELALELHRLAESDPAVIETTLLIHPQVLGDFLDYNDFLEVVDATVEDLGYEGELQVASFHPDYQFDGTEPDDVDNASNRSPYPTLHLLREASIEAAVDAFPEAAEIYDRNIETLRALGAEGWRKLLTDPA